MGSYEGTYILFIAPHDVDGEAGSEVQTRDRIREAVGLLATLYGRNIVYQHLFDNLIDMASDKASGFSPVFENPLAFPAVKLDSDEVGNVSAAIARLPERDQNRVYLALKWLQYAIYDLDGITAFIKYWVAIETLAMPDTANIRPIEDLLSGAYKIDLSQVRQTFFVGLLQSLRSSVIHDGYRIGIQGHLLHYVEALFSDFLRAKLGLECLQKAQATLSSSEIDLRAYTHEILKYAKN